MDEQAAYLHSHHGAALPAKKSKLPTHPTAVPRQISITLGHYAVDHSLLTKRLVGCVPFRRSARGDVEVLLLRLANGFVFPCTSVRDQESLEVAAVRAGSEQAGVRGKLHGQGTLVEISRMAVSYTHLTLPTKRIV
eukprot:TRINITY_DN61915_c0_g1_i1.p2 TRINITY_DN61915_c0_g1~~TRINITY_DN61915_c0_g1_i1.p2  ORF type:complete len:136 (-),score=18.99 TRINITY_DN61915_c0_g1_i1:123-530(-)